MSSFAGTPTEKSKNWNNIFSKSMKQNITQESPSIDIYTKNRNFSFDNEDKINLDINLLPQP